VSRGLGDVYKRQVLSFLFLNGKSIFVLLKNEGWKSRKN
jgi:hypothetical protein